MELRAKLRRLEDRAPTIAAQTQEDQKLERERAIMRIIVDKFARLKASGKLPDLDPLAQAVGNVVAAQYADLGEESHKYIADGWTETLKSWSRLEWMVKAGREGPPDA
jgi:hypothetical protein